MTQPTNQNHKVVKRKIIRKRIPTNSDLSSENTIVPKNSVDVKTSAESNTKSQKPFFAAHTGLVHTDVRLAPLDKYSTSEYTGFVNLLILLFIVMMSRLVVENWQKYGNLVHAPMLTSDELTFILYSLSMLSLHYAIGYWIELSRQNLKMITNSMRWHTLNALFILVEQTLYVGKYCTRPASGIGLLLLSSILVLKLFSFALVTTNTRKPVDLKCYLMFLLVPTLCFQYEYPKAPSRSIFKALRYLFEFLIAAASMVVLSQQYAEPTLETSISLIKLGELTLPQLSERILKLSLSVSLIWLAMFYGFFHAYLYFWAEVTMFGDRLFYREWWNSSELGSLNC
eukprot:NODE_401_length_9344_cov_0.427366.p3 type:complete len:341 gc:universal NODE_401_length_9344_cov_0.427366:5951-4929(-)